MTILNILNQLAATGSRTEKQAILDANKDNELLQRFFYLALDPMVTFGIRKIPAVAEHTGAMPLAEGMEALAGFADRTYTGNAAIDRLHSILSNSTADDAEVIARIIEKDPKCGVADSSANKTWKDLIFSFPVMKASPHEEDSFDNVNFPAYSQTKLDGSRCAVVVADGKVSVLSSSGREITTHGKLDWFAQFDNQVFDGELLYADPATGKFAERKVGNGIVNKAVRGTISVEEAAGLHIVLFDVIPLADWKKGKCLTPYHTRLAKLSSIQLRHNASIVETRIVNSEAEAVAHCKQMFAEGQEGTLVKDFASIWEGKRRKDHIKLKGLIDCDLRVTGWEAGTGKHEGKIGALVVSSEDGLVVTRVGTGLKDADRAKDPSFYMNKIVRVTYNERIKNKAAGSVWALFLPRLGDNFVRLDKNVADTINNIPLKATK